MEGVTCPRRQMWSGFSITVCRRFFLLIFILSLFLTCFVSAQVRRAAVAGQFYPADPIQLATEINEKLVAASAQDIKGEIVGLVAPHAGYQFSAAIAAAAYKQVQGVKYDVIVVLAPSHRDSFRGATIYPGDAYETPLGRVNIDKNLAQKMAAMCDFVRLSEYGPRAEHAIEVQLPFIQTLFPGLPILPIDVGYTDWAGDEKIAGALATLLKNKKALLIASTDLYHGESHPECLQSCSATLAAITALSPQRLYDGLAAEKYQACGGAPVVIMQIAAKALGADQAKLLAQTNSNDVTGQQGGYVVGYGAAAVYRAGATKPSSAKIEYQPLDKTNQITLVKTARAAIEQYVRTRTLPAFAPQNGLLQEKRGVFVTLTKNGQLRGCIGYHESDVPLYQLVPQMAIAAATEDPRFPPVQPGELADIKIKVSVYLTNVYKINSLAEFVMGRHGIILRKGRYAATYLPEVPLEAGWKTVEEEMASLCQKAGLPPDAWKSGAEFWVYRTQVFDENLLQ